MNSNIYMTREQIGRALEYSDEKGIIRMHERNKDSMDSMSVEIKRFNNLATDCGSLQTPKNIKPNTLLYNEDGIYEITFLSRQPKANEFRNWVRERVKEIRKYGIIESR